MNAAVPDLNVAVERAADRQRAYELGELRRLFEKFECHRKAWEATDDGFGFLIDDHPDNLALLETVELFAAFPVETAEGKAAKAGFVLKSGLLHDDIFECLDDARLLAFLRSIAGLYVEAPSPLEGER